MKKLYFVFLIFFAANAGAQESEAAFDNDTTIYTILSETARFPGCEHLDTTIAVKNSCAEASVLSFFNSNIVYPWDARQNGISGMVVVNFVVEKDGLTSNPKLLKDIGGGCGAEAMRIAEAMNDALIKARMRWTPGMKDGKPVRSRFTLPIRFKLTEPPEFVMVGRDTVYVVMDDSISYKGGEAALETFVKSNLKYPSSYKDSCYIGDMDIKALVFPDGLVKVLDVSDFFNLGFDFQFEAIQLGTATSGNWNPATYQNRNVPASIDLSLSFIPTEKSCSSRVDDYNRALQLAGEGENAFNAGTEEIGLEKLNEAIALFPENANFRYLRGQALMNSNKLEEACADFMIVKEVLPNAGVVNELIPLICN